MAAISRFLVIGFALFCVVEDQIWGPPVVEGLVSVDTVVPVMLLRLVRTHRRLVPVDVEDQWVDRLQIALQPLLIRILWIQTSKLLSHHDNGVRIVYAVDGW